MQACPLCGYDGVVLYFEDKRRPYLQCEQCHLVFVEPKYFLSAAQEKAEYDKHENNALDQAYRTFLSRVLTALAPKLSPQSHGLDFGCGPGPTLSVMLEELGHRVDLYDIFYYPQSRVLTKHYQFVTATEVVEHLHRPGDELTRLWHLIKPGGHLAIMTKLVIDASAFSRWHYKNDPTHVCFFSKATLEWLRERWQAQIEFYGDDVVLLTKEQNTKSQIKN